MAKTKQQLKFAAASAKARKEGIKPFTKKFGARVRQLLSKRGGKSGRLSPKKRSSLSKTKGSTRSTLAKQKQNITNLLPQNYMIKNNLKLLESKL